jgi:hypothetical protein
VSGILSLIGATGAVAVTTFPTKGLIGRAIRIWTAPTLIRRIRRTTARIGGRIRCFQIRTGPRRTKDSLMDLRAHIVIDWLA